MQQKGLCPTSVTYLCILNAFGSIGAAEKGEQIHAEIARQGLIKNNVLLGNALVDMYAKCGALWRAQQVLEELPDGDVVSWNALIVGYAQQGQGEQALECFQQMLYEGKLPNEITFLCILKGNALVDMYAKCGAFLKAQRVLKSFWFEVLKLGVHLLQDMYGHHSQGEQALKCFEQMQHEGVCPDSVTFLCVLKACTKLGATERGEQLYDEIERQGMAGKDTVFGNALVDMYAKCGDFAKALRVLEELPIQNFVSWNGLITGYAHHGQAEQALQCLEQMQKRGLSPDAVTLLCILKACGSIGRVDNAEMYFLNMNRKYGIKPNLKHYTCIVDVFGRLGELDKAIGIIETMDLSDHSIALWSAVLGACEKWGDVNVGKWAFEHAIQEDVKDPAAYILMANTYAASGMQEHAKSTEALWIENSAWRKLRQS